MPDIVWTGGLREAVKIAGLADTHRLPIAPHDRTGPVNLFACQQLCAATPNAMVVETVRGFCEGCCRDAVAEAVPVRGGHAMRTGFGAGLGMTSRPEILAQPGVTRRIGP